LPAARSDLGVAAGGERGATAHGGDQGGGSEDGE
jgi:hypothetical protein